MSLTRSTTCRLHNHYSSSPTSQNHCRIKPLFCAAVSKTKRVPSVTWQKQKKEKKDNDGSETERYGVGHTLVFHDQIMHVIFYVIMEIDGTIWHYFELWVGHTHKQKKKIIKNSMGPDSLELKEDYSVSSKASKLERCSTGSRGHWWTHMDHHVHAWNIWRCSFFPWITSSTRTCSSYTKFSACVGLGIGILHRGFHIDNSVHHWAYYLDLTIKHQTQDMDSCGPNLRCNCCLTQTWAHTWLLYVTEIS